MVQLIAPERRETTLAHTNSDGQPTAGDAAAVVGELAPTLRELRELEHEVGNALTPALGYVEFLLRRAPEWTDERDRRALTAIAGGLRRARWLVSRGRAGASPLPQDLGALVEAMVCQMPPARRGDAVVRRRESQSGQPVRLLVGEWDTDRVAQILANLLSNAAKYSAQGTPIHVDVDASGAWAEVAVTDCGIGIEPGDLEAVFGGHRTEAARRRAAGSGIGLSLSRRLAEMQGGSLTATSVPGCGSTFVLRLPLGEETDGTWAA